MVLAIGCVGLLSSPSLAAGSAPESLADALASAYADNPSLNAQRASLRATDENVPQALSGYRPTVSAGASVGATTFSNSLGTTYEFVKIAGGSSP